MSVETRPARFGPWKREALAFFELFALAGIAVAQPTFDVIGKNASSLVVNGRTRPQILTMTILVLVVPPVLAWLAEVVVGLVAPALRRYAHAAIAAVIVATIAVEALKKQTTLGSLPLIVGGVILGVAGGYLIFRFDVTRTFLHYLAFAPVAFAILFVFFSPASKVIFPGSTEAAAVTVGKPTHVVMVVMDEFPVGSLLDGTGKVDAGLFPNFAKLAADSSWYRNDTTVSPFTETAVPAILTGDMPKSPHAVPVGAEYPNNLFTLLGKTYTMNVHETITHLCPGTLCRSTLTRTGHAGLRGFLFDTGELWRDFASPLHTSTGVAKAFDVIGTSQLVGGPFVRSIRPATGPQLDFVHVVLPHQGWHFIPTGQDNIATYESQQVFLKHEATAVWPTDWSALIGRQRHLLQLQYADTVLGQIMDKLRATGGYDNSLLVVTADHGVAFSTKEPVRGVSAKNYPQVMWTPLFIKRPGQTQPTVSDQPVRDIDVLPTIADLLDTKLPWKVDGRSILGRPRAEGPLPILEWPQNTLKPPAGKIYSTVDGATGFATMIKSRTPPADANPALRLYRLGPYGRLVGTSATPLVRDAGDAGAATITNPTKFNAVNPLAHFIPWTWINGTLSPDVKADTPLAITVNGVVAGIAEAYQYSGGNNTYWSMLPPQLFRAGSNTIAIYRIDGAAEAPTLVPLKLNQ